MKRLLGAILLVTFLNGCAGLPLVSTLEGSLSINGAIAGVTGNYERQAVNAFVNLASHKSTGKTVSQHLYAAVETKYTKKRLEKHFKNKELSVTNFEIANKSLSDFGGFLPKDNGQWFFGTKKVNVHKDPRNNSIHPGKIHANIEHNPNKNWRPDITIKEPYVAIINNAPVLYVKLANYTVLDKYAPNFKHKMNINKENVDFTLQCNFSYYCSNTDASEITF